MLSLRQLTSSLRMRKSGPNSLFAMDFSLPLTATSPTSSASFFYRTSRTLCLLTTCVAFLLGVVVGIAVPLLYVVPGATNSNQLVPSAFISAAPNRTTATAAPPPPARLFKDDANQLANAINRVTFVVASEASQPSQVSDAANQPPHHSANSVDVVTGESVQGVYWSDAVEQLLPAGFDDSDAKRWTTFSRSSGVVRLDEGCGRMQNRLVTFDNGTRACCRYRQNYDQIQGEIFSFYLSRLLGLRNLPPSALGLVRPLSDQWSAVRPQLSLAQWAEDRPVVYTQFLEHLEPAYIPAELRGADRKLSPTDVRTRRLADAADRDQLLTLAQWSDLLVLDYLTANLDRMVNNLYNMQWNPAMMDSPAHNLARNTKTGLLVFLDNESGLLHGYRLLDKYEAYHKSLLDALCVFRKPTVDALRRLQQRRDVGPLLRRSFETRDAHLLDYLPFLPEKSVKTLNYRIDRVLDQVAKCQSLYGV